MSESEQVHHWIVTTFLDHYTPTDIIDDANLTCINCACAQNIVRAHTYIHTQYVMILKIVSVEVSRLTLLKVLLSYGIEARCWDSKRFDEERDYVQEVY